MRAIPVLLGERSYTISVTNTFRHLPEQLRPLHTSRDGWIISHRRVLTRYGGELLGALRRDGWHVQTLCVPESETSKTLATVQRVIRVLARGATMRVPVLFALGGGVVGDVTGFVAAVFRRGIPYIQVPTTLLAQVDSAIGGKTGVDLPEAKNLVGAFHQPCLVYNNVALLRSLPMRQRRSGLAEVIKYGVMADRVLFEFLEEHLPACLSLELRTVRVMVERSCRIKARVVSRDERETKGVRLQLNFGHTIGHALEAATRYRRWTHGEAIAIGMCAATELAVDLGRCPRADLQRLVRLVHAAGLPTAARRVSSAAVWNALRYDKKFIHGRPRWVLPKRIGQVAVTEAVPEARVRRVLAKYLG